MFQIEWLQEMNLISINKRGVGEGAGVGGPYYKICHLKGR